MNGGHLQTSLGSAFVTDLWPPPAIVIPRCLPSRKSLVRPGMVTEITRGLAPEESATEFWGRMDPGSRVCSPEAPTWGLACPYVTETWRPSTGILDCEKALPAHLPSVLRALGRCGQRLPLPSRSSSWGHRFTSTALLLWSREGVLHQTSWALYREDTKVVGGSQLSQSLTSGLPGTA